jgi:hypothetical protein
MAAHQDCRHPLIRGGRLTLTAVAICCCVASCAKPPIDTGANSVVDARKSLEGTWNMLSLEVAALDGRQRMVEANGTLVLDAFGNLDINYRVADAGLQTLDSIGLKSPNPLITTSGKVVIDPTQRKVTYLAEDAAARAFDPDLAARRANPFALERPRYYSLDTNGVMTLTTRYDNGKDAATSRWRKEPTAPSEPEPAASGR